MKDIKEVLHLYLYCQCQLQGDDHVKTFTLTTYNLNYYRAWISEIKPILKRLSDMSEEDADECYYDVMNGQRAVTNTIYAITNSSFFPSTNIFQMAAGVKFLISKGYWLFGDEAFDQGLIIDSKTLK
jgi:hypothetical protein